MGELLQHRHRAKQLAAVSHSPYPAPPSSSSALPHCRRLPAHRFLPCPPWCHRLHCPLRLLRCSRRRCHHLHCREVFFLVLSVAVVISIVLYVFFVALDVVVIIYIVLKSSSLFWSSLSSFILSSASSS